MNPIISNPHNCKQCKPGAAWCKELKTEAAAMIAHEQRHIHELRAEFVDMICSHYREGGAEIRLVKADAGQYAGMDHLFVNGKCVGIFDADKNGLVFRAINYVVRQ